MTAIQFFGKEALMLLLCNKNHKEVAFEGVNRELDATAPYPAYIRSLSGMHRLLAGYATASYQ